MSSSSGGEPSNAHDRARGMIGALEKISESADGEALRCSRVLAMLDVKKARELSNLGSCARELAQRLERWSEVDTTRETRRADSTEFQRVIEMAARLGITTWV